ncbi:sensor histidine kinase [Streptomyces sp. LHD-70]|uniref:sensor histidine kinase n=1 Tax=Streptomyces sp. LHD-70 TaxID=3072140 RepID=UPI00280F9088|nr:sensor histidine kinase [Streptomyces sp. LHD-70]MDQ8701994.1 sensor histidine kinase [Streptomyces sp. LHD-70]
MGIRRGITSRLTRGAAAEAAPLDAATAHAQVERRWELFLRWGPYALLGFTAVLLVATDGFLLTSTAERWAAAGLVVAGFALQVWWTLVSPRHSAGPSTAGAVYYGVRWAIAFVLSWLNPFAAFYAVLGYFGAERELPRRMVPVGLFGTAVTIAGSQSGGFPPGDRAGWLLFAAVLAVHIVLIYVFGQLALHEEKRATVHRATIAELEETNARLQQALDENAALHTQLLVQAREAGVADERRRLAAEIHDTIAQGLTGIIAQLQVVSGTADPALAEEHLNRASALARHSLGEARRSVQNLGPAALEHHALPEALKQTVAEWAERTGVRARFTVTGTAEPLHDEIEATLLRIAQEALSNADRHAGAGRVGVTLSYMAGEVALDVRDDGRGFEPLAVEPRSGSGGFGLDGMRARAERVAGAVTVESERGQGTAVSARVPLLRHDQ